MKILKTLQNPFALVLQGFLVGGLLFWTIQGQASASAAAAPSSPPLVAIAN